MINNDILINQDSKLITQIKACKDKTEKLWDINCTLNYITDENQFFQENKIKKETTQKPIDADKFLGIQKGTVGITCKNCKIKDVEYKEIQDRSGDEGSSYKCKCRSCGFQWMIKM